MEFYHVVLNGQIRPAVEAQVPLMSPALFSSFGVYETVEVVQGVGFHLEDHLTRMVESAAMIEMELPYSVADMVSWAKLLIREAELDACRLRVVVLGATQADEEVLVAMVPQPLPRISAEEYEQGAQAVTFAGSRSLPRCKSLNTLVNYLSLRQAERSGAREAILCDSGEMTEGSRSNIFAVHKGRVITPPSDRVLDGITRDIVIRLAGEIGLSVVEGPLPVSAVRGFDEFFVTSTSMHVMPIVAINGEKVGSGFVGPVTQQLGDLFERYHGEYIVRERG
jgi:branched-subunit amino acid aminotransferase/4-amino-4-deoxychorismate lyase